LVLFFKKERLSCFSLGATTMSETSLRQKLADLHAERVRTYDPAALKINIDQRAELVEAAKTARFVRAGDRVVAFAVPSRAAETAPRSAVCRRSARGSPTIRSSLKVCARDQARAQPSG